MLPNIFEGAKVGDDVFSLDYGWGKLTGADLRGNYPVLADFRTGEEEYTVKGQRFTDSPAPTCWPAHLVPEYCLNLHPRPKRKISKEIKGFLILSSTGDVRGFTEEKPSVADGYMAVPVCSTYEVEE